MASFTFKDEGEAGNNVHSGNGSHYIRDPPPFSVVKYIERDVNRLHGQRSSAMHLAGDVREIPDVCPGPMHDHTFGTWTKRWRHWSGRLVTDSYHFSHMDSPNVRCFQEVGHEKRLGNLLRLLGDSLF